MDDREKRLLDFVAASSAEGNLQVKDLLCLSNIGSQATVHGAIKRLVKKGFISLVEDAEDKRGKRLKLTKKSLARYAALEKAMLKAL